MAGFGSKRLVSVSTQSIPYLHLDYRGPSDFVVVATSAGTDAKSGLGDPHAGYRSNWRKEMDDKASTGIERGR